MLIKRTIEGFIRQATKLFPVVLVTGARQVGKTTLLRHLADERRTWVSLDDPMNLSLAHRDPALFFQRFQPPLLIDEIQYAPNLLPYIKMAADQERRPGMFWMTGSQPFHLMKGVSESLAGRVGIVQLMGFSRRETLGQPDLSGPLALTPDVISERTRSGGALPLNTLYETIWRGSFPVMVQETGMSPHAFFGAYVQTYLQRDVRDLARVGDEMAFLRFLRIAAARTAQLLNLTAMARDADIAVNTAKAWLSILQISGLVYLLEPYHTNVTARLVKAPKLYFLDTGLAAYLTEWSSPQTLEAGAFSGAMLETWVVSELLKGYMHQGRHPPFYFYRDKDKREIDLLVVADGVVSPVEIKKTASPDHDDIRHFRALGTLGMPVGHGGLVCLASDSIPLSDQVVSVPVGAL